MIINKKGTTEALVMYSNFDIKKVRFDFKVTFVNKPRIALWTSTWNSNYKEIPWIEWCLRERFDMNETLYKIISSKTLKIYQIDSADDYEDSSLPKDTEDFIDYNKLKELGFDGLHITRNGSCLGHDFTYKKAMKLNGFDCESTVWFNTDWIDNMEVIGRIRDLIR